MDSQGSRPSPRLALPGNRPDSSVSRSAQPQKHPQGRIGSGIPTVRNATFDGFRRCDLSREKTRKAEFPAQRCHADQSDSDREDAEHPHTRTPAHTSCTPRTHARRMPCNGRANQRSRELCITGPQGQYLFYRRRERAMMCVDR